MGHSSQVQQGSGIDVLQFASNFNHVLVGSGIDVLQFASNFNHVLVPMREANPENFSLIALIVFIL